MRDAAEIARLRADATYAHGCGRLFASISPADALSLLDALEQARKEREDYTAMMREAIVYVREQRDAAIAQRDQAQKDAKDARAMAYEECAKYLAKEGWKWPASALRARIEAMLEKMP